MSASLVHNCSFRLPLMAMEGCGEGEKAVVRGRRRGTIGVRVAWGRQRRRRGSVGRGVIGVE